MKLAPDATRETESMICKVLIATGLGLFALVAAPIAPVISDAPGMSAAAQQPKQPTVKKKVAKKSNVQSKLTYDSGTRRYMTSSDLARTMFLTVGVDGGRRDDERVG
ncbi:MAG: hypothetical protein K2Y29_10230, partial [Beijerinckiaceae bacterium]|nr:hypothetical protein [Beijerinckiaceae bacterium]